MFGTLGTDRLNNSSNLQTNHKQKHKKGDFLSKSFFFFSKKITILDHYKQNVMYQLQSSCGYDRGQFEKQTDVTKSLATLGQTFIL